MRRRAEAFRESGNVSGSEMESEASGVEVAAAGAGNSSTENAAAESIWQQVEAMPEFVSASRVLIYMSLPGEVPTRDFIARWYGRKQFVLPLVCQGSIKNTDQGCNSLCSGAGNILEVRDSLISRASKSESEPCLELRKYDPRWLVSGYRGIEEPSVDAPLVAPSDIDLALIPGVAFARGVDSGNLASRDDFARGVDSGSVADGDVFARGDSGDISHGAADTRNSDVWRLGRGGGFYDRLLPRLTCPTIGICFSYRVLDALPLDPWDVPLTHLVTNI